MSENILVDLFVAYYDARHNKRNTLNQLIFEEHMEENLFQLYDELIADTYTISPSICFIIKDPVKREIFASSFRDRVVHHLIYNYLYDHLDRHFIYDSYSCRKRKWTHFGIKRLDHFIRSCSANYSKEAYILKLDIKWFFMHIDKDLLKQFLKKQYSAIDSRYRALIVKIIDHDPTKNYSFYGDIADYDDLPHDKSLFWTPEWIWLPIGNLTSQLFANVYLDTFDKRMKYTLWLKRYGRYVDDFVIVHHDKNMLKQLVPRIKERLQESCKLTLHPKKIYLQHYTKWVTFLWSHIKPYRIYIKKSTIGNAKKAIQNRLLTEEKDKDKLRPTVNAYLWMMSHRKSRKQRKKIAETLTHYGEFEEDFTKILYSNDTNK